MAPKYTTQTKEIHNKGKTLHILNRELVLDLTKTHRIHLTNPGKVYHTSKNDFYTRSDTNTKADAKVCYGECLTVHLGWWQQRTGE